VQFSCDSCKTQLQIADEKVRGKRLVVRCRRCGAKITIADPALAGKLTKPSQPRPSKPAVPASQDEASGWSPKTVAEPAAPASAAPPRRTTDSENTLAIDSAMLERALLASKEEDPELQSTRAPAPDVATPADPPLWFAMLQGKQEGPLSRGDIEDRVANGEVGPRTYLWKEGMDAWQRAKEVPELSSLFPPPPEEPPLPPQAAAPEEEPARETAESAFTPAPADANADLASWANSDLAHKTNPGVQTPPQPVAPAPQRVRSSTPMFESTAPPRSRGAFGIVVLAIVAAVVVGGLLFFRPDRGQHAQAAAPDVAADAATAEAPPAAVDAGIVEAAPAVETTPRAAAGLTADQVRKKLDDHKPALQTCVDEALKRDPKLRAGKIHVVATIAPSGQVTAVKIDKRAIDEAPLGACLKRTTRKIAFPSFAGDPFDVDIPIVVTAGE
jgi:predicted Zn finger-like uncharacterized protein